VRGKNVPVVGVLRGSEDAFGRALLDHHEGRLGPPLILERDDGSSGPAMQPEKFFLPHEAWPWWERYVVGLAAGAVLIWERAPVGTPCISWILGTR
jgi:hypothetical protein